MDINKSIECVVEECKYNDNVSNYCTLNKIKVEKNELTATSVESTDCGSFETKQ